VAETRSNSNSGQAEDHGGLYGKKQQRLMRGTRGRRKTTPKGKSMNIQGGGLVGTRKKKRGKLITKHLVHIHTRRRILKWGRRARDRIGTTNATGESNKSDLNKREKTRIQAPARGLHLLKDEEGRNANGWEGKSK